jgi:hypothetical protein
MVPFQLRRLSPVRHSILDDPEHWRQRAEEARSIADQLSDPESKRTILRIANDYERMAEHAEVRAKRQSQASSN